MTRKLPLLLAAGASLAAAAPAQAEIAIGLQSSGRTLSQFDTATPQSVTTIPVMGLEGTETLDTIAFRPATGVLYGTTGARKLYTIDFSKSPAEAKPVRVFFPAGPLGDAGAGFNPTNDLLRYVIDGVVAVNDGNPSLSVSPNADGTTTRNGDLKFVVAANGDPRISGVGYTNLFAGTPDTTLFGVDTGMGNAPRTVTISPMTGDTTVVGETKQQGAPGQADIEFSPASNQGFGLLGQGVPTLHRVNTQTGEFTDRQPIASPTLTEFTIVPSGLLGVSAGLGSEQQRIGGFVVTRTRGSVGTVKVDFTTVDGTAKAGSDYAETKGTLTFAPGETQKIVPLRVADDGAVEGDETFSFQLSKPTDGAVIGAASFTATITDSGAKANPPDTTPIPPTTGGGTPPPARGAKPTFTLSKKSVALKTLRSRGKVAVRFTCTSTCSATGTLKIGSKTIGSARRMFATKSRRSATLNVRLSKTGLKTLGKTKTRSVKLSVRVSDAAAQTTAKTATFKATAAKKKR